MEYIITILACLAVISSLLKMGFYPWKGLVAAALTYGLATGLLAGWLAGQSHDMVSSLLSSRPMIQNLAVAVVLEAVVMIASCFHKNRILRLYPGLLSILSIGFLQMQLFIVMPGISFTLMAWLSGIFVAAGILIGAWGLRWLVGNEPQRRELLFLVNVLMAILCVVATGGIIN